MIYLKVHHTQNGGIIAMCDEELLGKVLKSGKIELDLERYSGFYKGALLDEERAIDAIKNVEVYSANVVGKESIKALKTKIAVSDSDIRLVGKVPYVQIYAMI